MNCKKALERFENDIVQAEKWLLEQAQKEGWAKASKLQGRPMSQGLVGMIRDDQRATLVEVNCETDFVAKNQKFHDLVSQVTAGCHNYFMAAPSSTLVSLPKEKLDALNVGDEQNVSDLVVLTVGSVGENVSARRVIHVGVSPDSHLATYMHLAGSVLEAGNCRMGKYAVVVDICRTPGESDEVDTMETVASNMCKHILGMKPKSIGDFENDKPLENHDVESDKHLDDTDDKHPGDPDGDDKPLSDSDSDDKPPGDSDSEEEEAGNVSKLEDTRLVFQEFMMDSDLLVGEYLKENNVTVNKFVRFECGEEIPSDDS